MLVRLDSWMIFHTSSREGLSEFRHAARFRGESPPLLPHSTIFMPYEVLVSRC